MESRRSSRFPSHEGYAMKQLARRASLVAVLLLLTAVGAASAECAWVLWEASHTFSQEQPESPASDWKWSANLGFQSRADCMEKRGQIIAVWSKDAGTHGGRDLTVTSSVMGERKSSIIRDASGAVLHMTQQVICLPDTVDPRGPKAGR